MKNVPKKIYLQIGGSDVSIDKSTTDWNDLFHGAIPWSDHRINDNDIEFVLSDVERQREQLVSFLRQYQKTCEIMHVNKIDAKDFVEQYKTN